jgi:acetyl-CoA carboxylase alpha subunit
VIDGIIRSRSAGRRRRRRSCRTCSARRFADALDELDDLPQDALRAKRRAKFRSMGVLA